MYNNIEDFLGESDVESITIDGDKTIAKLKVPNLALYINEQDQRSIAIETLNFKVYEKNDSHMIYGILNWLKKNEKNPIIFDIGANEGILQ